LAGIKVIREVFLEGLPRNENDTINWRESIGYTFKFIYDDLNGEIEIVNYNSRTRYITIRYENYHEFEMYSGNLNRGALGGYLNNIVISAPWMIKYFKNGYAEAMQYTKCSTVKINALCPDCNRIKTKKILISDIYNKKSIGCSCGGCLTLTNLCIIY